MGEDLSGQNGTSQDIEIYRPRRLTHANLFVANMERSMDFYRRVVGLEESYRRVNLRAGFLTNGNSHHDIGVMEYAPTADPKRDPQDPIGLNHLAFEMENDYELVAWYRRATGLGQHIHRVVGHGNTHSLYMHDPDGNQIEVYCDTLKEWWTLKTGIMTSPLEAWTPGAAPPSMERNYIEDPDIGRVEDAVFHPVRTTHAVLLLSKFEAGFRFYTEIVGLEPLTGGPDSRFCILTGGLGEPCLALFRASDHRPAGFHHVGLEVWSTGDLAQSKRQMSEAGIAAAAEIDHPSRASVCVRDIDGFLLQLYAAKPNAAPVDWDGIDEETALYLV